MTDADRSRTLSGLVHQVSYGIAEQDLPVPATAARRAREIVERRLFSQPPGDYYNPISAALSDGEPEVGDAAGQLHVFLRRLLSELDQLRPWPEPAFLLLRDTESASGLWSAPVIGHVEGTFRAVTSHVRGYSAAHRLPDGGSLVVIRLSSGQIVGLRTTGSHEQSVALVSTNEATETSEFEKSTGLQVVDANRSR